jgi:cellulose synthase/poly-beta-1,6-N-acetylglucosamine synthase-like glycosyltransferase
MLLMVLLLLLSLLASVLYALKLREVAQETPGLPLQPQEGELPPLTVIIPAYNEAENIEDCVCSVLSRTNLPPERLEVWVVDDQSVDPTAVANSSKRPSYEAHGGSASPW